ncbi:MAG: proteasome assembly chaperone family protein [Thermoplasmata archaeon]|nr:proteasome assembly chaperone family protein [Thermoplasmata archaeon]
MDKIEIHYDEKPDLDNPIFIEGLPGIGNVGKLAAEHLIDQLKGKKFADIISKHFPPQVVIEDNGVVRLVDNQLYYAKRDGANQDLVILTGDYQGLTPEGQYELSDFILGVLKELNVKRIFTLGGYGIGRMIKKPRVLGAATEESLVKEMKKLGVVFSRNEPGAGIVGASGLLLGMAKYYGMKSVCLMGETSGYFVDPKSAQAVLEVLAKILDVTVNYDELEAKAKQIDSITARLKEIEAKVDQDEDLGYIG